MYMRIFVFLIFSVSPKVTRRWGFSVLGSAKAFEGELRIVRYLSEGHGDFSAACYPQEAL